MVNPITSILFFPLIVRLFNFRYSGICNVPKHENFIFAMNHSSAIDVPLALSAIVPYTKRHLSVVVDSRWYDFPLLNPVLYRWQAIRKDAFRKEKKREVIFEAKNALDKGNNVLI